MRTIEQTVYTYDELSDEAKEKAREWYKGIACRYNWYDTVYEDVSRVADLLGITFDTKGKSNSPTIYFSGFSSQGDGACFEGSYRYAKGALKAIKAYASQDEELHRIAKELQRIQQRSFYSLRATTEHSGFYYHSGCMRVSVEDIRDNRGDASDEAEEDLTQALRDFADWIYDQLEKEYDHQMSDEVAEEMIAASEYEFDEEGNRS